eukprot:GDKH01009879.1.p1 GENE.GDKH01009879.1~~GDKH01009879.1.p1  ORF type:complete len:59 (+),score=0.28 GDKH01009879.1:176-352(+)
MTRPVSSTSFSIPFLRRKQNNFKNIQFQFITLDERCKIIPTLFFDLFLTVLTVLTIVF